MPRNWCYQGRCRRESYACWVAAGIAAAPLRATQERRRGDRAKLRARGTAAPGEPTTPRRTRPASLPQMTPWTGRPQRTYEPNGKRGPPSAWSAPADNGVCFRAIRTTTGTGRSACTLACCVSAMRTRRRSSTRVPRYTVVPSASAVTTRTLASQALIQARIHRGGNEASTVLQLLHTPLVRQIGVAHDGGQSGMTGPVGPDGVTGAGDRTTGRKHLAPRQRQAGMTHNGRGEPVKLPPRHTTSGRAREGLGFHMNSTRTRRRVGPSVGPLHRRRLRYGLSHRRRRVERAAGQ